MTEEDWRQALTQHTLERVMHILVVEHDDRLRTEVTSINIVLIKAVDEIFDSGVVMKINLGPELKSSGRYIQDTECSSSKTRAG